MVSFAPYAQKTLWGRQIAVVAMFDSSSSQILVECVDEYPVAMISDIR
jgi:hypothetical protein